MILRKVCICCKVLYLEVKFYYRVCVRFLVYCIYLDFRLIVCFVIFVEKVCYLY